MMRSEMRSVRVNEVFIFDNLGQILQLQIAIGFHPRKLNHARKEIPIRGVHYLLNVMAHIDELAIVLVCTNLFDHI